MSDQPALEDILLPAAQQEACEMLGSGKTQIEMALALGVSRQALVKRFSSALATLGADEMKRRYTSIHVHEFVDKLVKKQPKYNRAYEKSQVNEAKRAARSQEALIVRHKALELAAKEAGGIYQVAEDLDATEAMQKLMLAAKAGGLPGAVIDALAGRVLRGMGDIQMMPEKYDDSDLRDELSGKVRMVLGHIDEVTMGGAKISELATTLRVLQEQVLLLDGRPTAILAVADKEGMMEISQRLQAELARRAIKNVDGVCEDAEED
tara:strand:+ start:17084 stop:17878 length:795 start_codon:yes stop_codon:yes gene_type:complete